ncbi:MAG: hypothetical protein HHJ09_08395 [Glaciimonas sp.]|nr:hypothetical protein [Glaciimonas sp.]
MAITQKDALLLFWVKISDKVKFSIKNVGNVPLAISLAAQKQANIFIMKQLQPCDGQVIIYPNELNAVAGTARDILFVECTPISTLEDVHGRRIRSPKSARTRTRRSI